MSSFAAILVLVACPINSGHCISEPVKVVSYEHASDCERQMPAEVKGAKVRGMRIIGSCNTFDASLMKGVQRGDMTSVFLNSGDRQPTKRYGGRDAIGFQDMRQ